MRRLSLLTLRVFPRHAILFLSAILLVPACEDEDDVIAPVPPIPSVAGTVISSATGEPVNSAEVSIGAATATTGDDGRFVLTDLTAGPATLRCIATGFEDFEADITVPTGRVTRDISLTRIELFEFGDFALHVPATVSTARGILLALGGPDTRGFVSGAPFGAPVPAVEASLQALGQEFRTIAANHGLAVLGTSLAAMPNGPDSDQLLLDAVQQAATLSGRPELASAPLFLYGMSGGGPQASGFTARNPERVAGLFLKVPVGVASLTSGEVLGVPTYVVQAEMDAFVDNAALASAFEANRRAGALWALALEEGVPHHSLTPGHRELTTHWMSTILDLRLGAVPSDPLRAIGEFSGWLGDPATGEVARWGSFAGDRATASWFPTQETAERWKTFVGAGATTAVTRLLIQGVMGELHQSVRIYRAGQAVTDAVVTLNGVTIPHYSEGLYPRQPPEALPAGSRLDLEVKAGGVTVEATVNLPEVPILTAPATGSVFAWTDSITVTWTTATDPDRFEVIIGGWDWGSIFPAPGNARELKIPASASGWMGDDVTVGVSAFDDGGSFTGPADPDSRITIVSSSPNAVLTIGP